MSWWAGVSDAVALRWMLVLSRLKSHGAALTVAWPVLSAVVGLRFVATSTGTPLMGRLLAPIIMSCALGLSVGGTQPLSLARYRRWGLGVWRAFSLLTASATVGPGALLTLWPLAFGFEDLGHAGWAVGLVLYVACTAAFTALTVRPISRSHGRLRWSLVGLTPRQDSFTLELARRSNWILMLEPLTYGCLAMAAASWSGAGFGNGALVGALVFTVFAGISAHNSIGRQGPGNWLQLVYNARPSILPRLVVPGAATLLVACTGISSVWLTGGDVLRAGCLIIVTFCWSNAVSQVTSVLVPYRTGRRHPVMRTSAPAGHTMLVQAGVLVLTAVPLTWVAARVTEPAFLVAVVGIGLVVVTSTSFVTGRILRHRLVDIVSLLTH